MSLCCKHIHANNAKRIQTVLLFGFQDQSHIPEFPALPFLHCLALWAQRGSLMSANVSKCETGAITSPHFSLGFGTLASQSCQMHPVFQWLIYLSIYWQWHVWLDWVIQACYTLEGEVLGFLKHKEERNAISVINWIIFWYYFLVPRPYPCPSLWACLCPATQCSFRSLRHLDAYQGQVEEGQYICLVIFVTLLNLRVS